jgi:hypothetical protein
VEKIRARLTELFVLTDGYLQVPKKRELPSAQNLKENADAFAQALNKYLAEYEKAGIYPKHFENMTEFVEDYNKKISEDI